MDALPHALKAIVFSQALLFKSLSPFVLELATGVHAPDFQPWPVSFCNFTTEG